MKVFDDVIVRCGILLQPVNDTYIHLETNCVDNCCIGNFSVTSLCSIWYKNAEINSQKASILLYFYYFCRDLELLMLSNHSLSQSTCETLVNLENQMNFIEPWMEKLSLNYLINFCKVLCLIWLTGENNSVKLM